MDVFLRGLEEEVPRIRAIILSLSSVQCFQEQSEFFWNWCNLVAGGVCVWIMGIGVRAYLRSRQDATNLITGRFYGGASQWRMVWKLNVAHTILLLSAFLDAKLQRSCPLIFAAALAFRYGY